MTTEEKAQKPYRGWFPAAVLILCIFATALFAPDEKDMAPTDFKQPHQAEQPNKTNG